MNAISSLWQRELSTKGFCYYSVGALRDACLALLREDPPLLDVVALKAYALSTLCDHIQGKLESNQERMATQQVENTFSPLLTEIVRGLEIADLKPLRGLMDRILSAN